MADKGRIAFCIERMDNPRGTERAVTSVCNLLCDVFDISIITSSQENFPDFFPLDSRVNRVDLKVNTHFKYNTVLYNRIKNDYKKKLSLYLIKERFDVVVALSGLQFYFLHSINDGSKKIAWYHFSYDISEHLMKSRFPGFLRKFVVKLHTNRRISHARKYDKMVVVSKSNQDWWNKVCNNVVYIYNPLPFTTNRRAELTNCQAMAAGSLTSEKGFDNLINAWSLVHQKHPKWNLNIFGEGVMKEQLQRIIQDRGLKDVVHLRGRSKNIEEEYLSHSLFILSSNTESFGLVLAEAASCGLPLVAYKCKEVITEIIEANKNGFIVEPVGDIYALADKICMLIESQNMRNEMGIAAINSANKFDAKNIKMSWIKLIRELAY